MTNMKRVTIAMPDQLDKAVLELRRTNDNFIRSSYSEIVRALIIAGIETEKAMQEQSTA